MVWLHSPTTATALSLTLLPLDSLFKSLDHSKQNPASFLYLVFCMLWMLSPRQPVRLTPTHHSGSRYHTGFLSVLFYRPSHTSSSGKLHKSLDSVLWAWGTVVPFLSIENISQVQWVLVELIHNWDRDTLSTSSTLNTSQLLMFIVFISSLQILFPFHRQTNSIEIKYSVKIKWKERGRASLESECSFPKPPLPLQNFPDTAITANSGNQVLPSQYWVLKSVPRGLTEDKAFELTFTVNKRRQSLYFWKHQREFCFWGRVIFSF